MAGNQEVTDLPVIPAVDGADVYGAKNNLDYRIRTGEAGGLATLDGSGKVPLTQIPASWLPLTGGILSGTLYSFIGAPGTQSTHIGYGKNNGVVRWLQLTETTGDLSLTGFDTAAANPKSIYTATYSSGNVTFTNDVMIGGPVGQLNYGGFGKGIVVQSINNSVFELASTRADGTGILIGAVSANFRTNTINHQRIADVQMSAEGATANQRGGRIGFYTKANASTVLSERMSVQENGLIAVNNNLTVGGTTVSTGSISTSGDVTAGNNAFRGGPSTVVLAPQNVAGTVLLRPNGPANATGQTTLDASGNIVVAAKITSSGTGDPGTGLGSTAQITQGAFGGGWTLLDGSTQSRIYMTNAPDLRIGLAPTTGAVTNYMIVASSGVTAPNFTATSDANLKKDVEDLQARERLPDLLRFVSFLWKADDRADVGLIAQEVQKVAPEYVHSSKNDEGIEVLSVDKASLALECVIGLAARVRELEDHLAGDDGAHTLSTQEKI